jgi:hypothetical protein
VGSTHINLTGRKALLGRLLAFEALDRRGPSEYTREIHDRILKEMIDAGDRAIRSCDNSQLDHWLLKTIEITEQTTANVYGSKLSSCASAEAILNELREAAEGLSCTDCSERVCNGSQRDDKAVTSRGLCFTSVWDVFDTARALAEAYYRQYAPTFVEPPGLILSTTNEPTKPHNIPIDVFVTGRTDFCDDNRKLCSNIEFKVAVGLLDWESWLAGLYVFLHELVCHAYAGIAPPNRGRPGFESFDPFAEGWMDRICYMILEDVGNGAIPTLPAGARPSRSILRAGSKWRDAGQRFHLHRSRPARDPGPSAYSVTSSVLAADAVFEILKAILRPPQKARKAMYRLSLEINLLDRSVDQRAKMITAVHRDLADRASVGHGSAILALRQYLRRGDASRFVDGLLRD